MASSTKLGENNHTHILDAKDLDFDFELPEQLIARQARKNRASAKMLYYNVSSDQVLHSGIQNIDDFFVEGDVCVLNTCRVLNVRFPWDYKSGQEEIVLLKCLSQSTQSSSWEAIVSGKKTKLNHSYSQGNFDFEISKKLDGGLAQIKINKNYEDLKAIMEVKGKLPVPPYIRKMRKKFAEPQESASDKEFYQTTYAEKYGGVAAPTAGLHFTESILNSLINKGVILVKIQLDVGWGTFQALSDKNWQEGRLHEERVSISKESALQLKKAIDHKKQILAVGTTCIRTLQWWHEQGMPLKSTEGICDSFIHYPWTSPVATSLLTNFHFPQTSLLHLVSAFIDDKKQTKLMELYKEAVNQRYMFYSYGDCMLIQRGKEGAVK